MVIAGKFFYVYVCMIEVRLSDGLQIGSQVTIHREAKPSKKRINFESTTLFRRNEPAVYACNVKRSEPVPLERGCYMSCFLPRAPLARSLGAEESSYIFMCI